MTSEEAEQILQDTASKLGEHFDAVQVLGSWSEQGITKCSMRGSGNWYARQGMAHEFINEDVAQTQAYHISKRSTDEDQGLV